MAAPSFVTEMRNLIPLTNDTIYLNTGFAGPNPRTVLEAKDAWMSQLYKFGLTTEAAVEFMEHAMEEARRRVALLLNCSPNEIALTGNVTEGINIALQGLDWQAGDEIMTTDLEHPGGLLPCLLLRDQYGVEVKVLPVPSSGEDFLAQLKSAMSPRTRAVVLSHVFYSSGAIMPLKEIAALAHRNEALCVVDAAQSAGHIPVDLKDLDCDFYSLPGQKWLLGPFGTGALYVKQELVEKVKIKAVGWESVRVPTTDGSLPLHNSARRFEFSTRPFSEFVGLTAALDLAERMGRTQIYSRIRHLQQMLRQQLAELPGITLYGSHKEEEQGALICFNLEGHRPEKLVQRLWEEHRVVCRWVLNPRCVRVCTHFFNTEEEIDTFLGILRSLA